MQQADITAITRELAGLVAERYVFPGLGADLSQLLEDRLADGRYTRARTRKRWPQRSPRNSSRSTATSTCASGTALANCPNAVMKRRELAAMAAWAQRTAGGIARAERLDGNVGYLDLQPLLFPPSIAGEAVAAAMTLIAPADALLIDVRQCLGGDPGMVAMVCTYLFGAEPVHLIDMISRPAADGTAAGPAVLDHAVRAGPPVRPGQAGLRADQRHHVLRRRGTGLRPPATRPGHRGRRAHPGRRPPGRGVPDPRRTCRRPSPSPGRSARSRAATGKVPASSPTSPWRPARRWTPPASGPGPDRSFILRSPFCR